MFVGEPLLEVSLLPLALPAVRAVDGVIDAEGTFTYAIDDTSLPRAAYIG